MPSLQLIFQIIAGLGPYFSVAILLAVFLGLFLPWGVMHPQKWLYFYIFSIAFFAFGGTDPDGSGSLFKQGTWGILYILCFISIYRPRKEKDLPVIHFPMELLILYGFIFISIGWSDYKLSSFKRYILLIGLLLIAVLSTKISISEKSFVKILTRPLAIFMLGGAVIAAALPTLAFDSDGALRAYTSHKNTWGQFMLLCSIIFFNKFLSRDNRKLYLPLLVISLAMLYMSKSATSLLAFIFSSLCVILLQSLSSKNMTGKLLVLALVLASAVSTLVYSILHGHLPFNDLIELVFKATDKSTTLTGRTFLWKLMGAEIERHPWFGTGFGGFWVGLEGAAGALVKRLDWGPPTQAHSGYIDAVNEIGFIGMAIIMVVLMSHIYRCCILYKISPRDNFPLHISIVISTLIVNYAESSLIQGTNISWIILTCSIIEVFNRVHAKKFNHIK